MIRRLPRFTRSDTLVPYTTLCRSRLGFAISTSVQHDITLLDEWVGPGDLEFMARAKERMQDRVGGSKIVVLASHSTGMLRDRSEEHTSELPSLMRISYAVLCLKKQKTIIYDWSQHRYWRHKN